MKTIEWGFLIIIYLFLGGLSAGLFFMSALATFLQRNGEDRSYSKVARYGALLAPWPVMFGCMPLTFGPWPLVQILETVHAFPMGQSNVDWLLAPCGLHVGRSFALLLVAHDQPA